MYASGGTMAYPTYPAQNQYPAEAQQYQQPLNNAFPHAPANAAQTNPFQNAAAGAAQPALSNPFVRSQSAGVAMQPGYGAPQQGPIKAAVPPPPTSAQMQQQQQLTNFQSYTNGHVKTPSTSAQPNSLGTQRYNQYYAAGAVNLSQPDVGHTGPSTSDPVAEQKIRDCMEFNALPHFVRSTTGRFPNSQSLKQKSHIPLQISYQCMAAVPAGYNEVSTVSYGSVGTVVRCKKCRAYINPFVTWEAQGRRWICNMCTYTNETPAFYYANVDETGKRADRYERPELSCGSVEYVAPGEYMVRPPQPPCFAFVIDVSVAAVQSGMLECTVQGIKNAILSGKMPGMDSNNPRTLISIIAYDNAVHFFSLDPNRKNQAAHMMTVVDLEDLFLPAPEHLVVNVKEAEKQVIALLDSLPNMFRNTKVSESCLFSAIKGAHLAMKHVGGKMLVTAATLPTVGETPLKASRDNPRLLNTEKESELLRPADDAYRAAAIELTRVQIGLDLFVAANSYMDVASLAPLCKETSGDLYYYPQFNAHAKGMKMVEELHHCLTRKIGWEGVLRVRVSKGWRIVGYQGHAHVRGSTGGNDLLVVPNCHEDQMISVALEMEENVIADPILCTQCALLYTSSEGERRIRVHTYCLPITQNLAEMTNNVDVQVMAAALCQQAIDLALKQKLQDAQQYLQNICSQMVGAAGSGAKDSMKVLPLYVLGMLKSHALRGSTDVPADLRAYHWTRIESLPITNQAAFFYPRMVSVGLNEGLEQLQLDEGGVAVSGSMATVMPQMSLTSEKMAQEGAYLLENGESMMMWLGKAVPPQWLLTMFGVQSLDQLVPDDAEALLVRTQNEYSARLLGLIRLMRVQRMPTYMKLSVVRQGMDPQEHAFFQSLVEDRPVSYAEFLQKIGVRTGGGNGGGRGY